MKKSNVGTDNLPRVDSDELAETLNEIQLPDADSTHAALPIGEQPTANINPTSTPHNEDFDFDVAATAAFHTSPQQSTDSKFSLQIPGYELVRELGRGAMGVVYAAKQVRADRLVALKVMLHQEHARKEEIERFSVEARAAARLQHPGIVGVYEVGEVKGCPFFTLEYVDGGTLAEKIRQDLLPHREVAEIMLAISNAVGYAHSREIIHRDLKPANILVDRAGQPKIADFGLARRMEDENHLTHDGMIIGTPNYMAPEQASGKVDAIGPLADVYSLGAILFELLTGRPPFKATTLWEVIRQVRMVEPVRPSELEPSVPKDLETICLKCLQKEPAKRYSSAQELHDDIRRHLNHQPISARPIGQWERLVRLCKRNPREAKLVATVAGLLLGFGVLASVAALRIWNDRNEIVHQRDQISDQKTHIEQQRDQIAKEKEISDDRLGLYRGTVSQLVNRFPRLIESAPISNTTKTELSRIFETILRESADVGDVGSSKQWGIMATKLRSGEVARATALATSDPTDLKRYLEQAQADFDEAVQIAQAVYDSPEPNRAKAASNLAIVLQRQAHTAFLADRERWQEQVPKLKHAMELAREAVQVTEVEKTVAHSEYQSNLGDSLFQYAVFLMEAKPLDAKHQERAVECLDESIALQQGVAAKAPEISVDALSRLANSTRLKATIALSQGNDLVVRDNYQMSLASLQQAIERDPARLDLLDVMAKYSDEYGDYLLFHGGQAAEIEALYERGLQALVSLAQTPQSIKVEQEGFAMQYYRLGLASLKSGNPAKAKQHFQHCAAIREKGYRDAVSLRADAEANLARRIDWLIALSRSGSKAVVIDEIKQVVQLIERPDYSGALLKKEDAYLQCSVCAGILSQTIETASDPERQSLAQSAEQLLIRAIDSGYLNLNYLKTDPDFEWLQKSTMLDSISERIENLHATK